MTLTLDRKAKRMGRFFYGGGSINNITEIANRDHGSLTGLGDDDHTQYPTAATFFSRMATVVVDTTTNVLANTVVATNLSAVAAAPRFYAVAMRGAGNAQIYGPGARVSAAEAVLAEETFFLNRASTTFADQIELCNGTAAAVDFIYKVYEYTGT